MPGKIVKLLVGEGEKVAEKQPMVIVEAMKMENQVNSPSAGTVRKINFMDGDQVGTEIPIIELEI
jgi:biotin carboxyl carrier protein